MGSSVFFWNWTNRTLVTASASGPISVSRPWPPFAYGAAGGGVTCIASSPYTSWASTSWACSND